MSSSPSEQSAVSPSSTARPFGSCWGCRLVSGSGLILSGGYVFQAARRVMRQGGPTSMGTVAQIVFAAVLASWGIVLIADPVGKSSKKT